MTAQCDATRYKRRRVETSSLERFHWKMSSDDAMQHSQSENSACPHRSRLRHRLEDRRSPFGVLTSVIAILLVIGRPATSIASECPGRVRPIEADRPDVTNSSVVVPRGSLQVENGVNWAVYQTVQLLDGSETRIRVGAFRCGEVLVDLPNYVRSLDGSSSEFSTLVMSVKRQLFIRSSSFSLSVAAGVGVPGRQIGSAGRGYSPYIQVPWSRSIGDEWSVNGMVTVTWSTVAKTLFEPTLVIEREFGRRGHIFAEYVGDYTEQDRPSQIIDVGGGWRLTSVQQLDFHIGLGLTRTAPHHYVGVGYSLRVNGLFARNGEKEPRQPVRSTEPPAPPWSSHRSNPT